MKHEVHCIKCGNKMILGFLVDHKLGGIMQSMWVEGEPEESLWSGTTTGDKPKYKVVTYCCENCRYLESYATDERVY